MNKPRILFLFSDTGGGHRSAAESIIEALEDEFPNRFEIKMIDFFRDYAPMPYNYAPEIYPQLSRLPLMWGLGYKVSDGRNRTNAFYNAIWPYLRRSTRKLLKENPAELIVSVHQLINTPILRARVQKDTRFVTVVTDLVSTHSAWYHTGADLVIVPTAPAREKALLSGLTSEKILVIGQPVAKRYTEFLQSAIEIKTKHNWNINLPIVLIVGGGEGMGHLDKHALAIDQARLNCQLIIVTGRNQQLKSTLENYKWSIPVKIYGFVRDMPEFMQASDVLITKAGPGTISEAFISGLPLILFSKMPGQENGNVGYVVENGAGIWAPEPSQTVEGLKYWLENNQVLKKVAQNALMLAKPEATRKIAISLADQVQKTIIERKKIRV
jgi:1,2-diacylglycerol 3-beta-galactosyltransferase